MSVIDGKTLSDCFSLVSRCGSELVSLCDVLNNLFADELARRRNHIQFLWQAVENDDRTDSSEWVYTDYASFFPIKQKGSGRKSVEINLGYQISLMGDGIAIPGNSEPLLHVFALSEFNFSNDEYVGFPMTQDAEYPLQIIDNHLLVWGDPQSKNWRDREWIYSLRLMALNSPDSLRDQVVKPAIALILGASATEALPETIDALFRYPQKDKFIVSE